jgi:UDP-2-acetamido-2,6-beta-L-arabino-hexul-4-ose reductase
MLKVGITGQAGFVGSHLYNTLALFPQEFCRIDFKRDYFDNNQALDAFVSNCDVIVHLAGINRHDDEQVIYNTNINLVKKLISSLDRTKSRPYVLMSSSSQENLDNLYGASKKEGRGLLSLWAKMTGAKFTGLIIPNIFGPFCKPMYNSVIATFSHLIANGDSPVINVDNKIKFIYIGEVITEIINKIRLSIAEEYYLMPHTSEAKVSEVLDLLMNFKEVYQKRGEIPPIKNIFELNLFNTYRSYINLKNNFPIKFNQHTDSRGVFFEIIRTEIAGQFSFSTTLPGITRGNHYHTRKIERFSVIKGKALIQLRRIGTDEIINFFMDGDSPSYVDMPIWYTHNIKNIGEEVLLTNFWINEFYNPNDPDTYFENV